MKIATSRDFTLSAAQCRAARGLLVLSRAQLAELAEVSERTLVDFERGARSPIKSTLSAIRRALEDAGVDFIPEKGGGAGVRLRKRR